MTIQEALNTLDQVCAGYRGTRGEHVALQQVMQTVTEALKPVPEDDPGPEEQESSGNK